jgi:hypothetical protein
MTRSSHAARRALGPGLVIWIVASCTTAGVSPDPSGSPRRSTVVVTPALPAASPAPSSAAPAASGDRPPDAHLAAEGGDPVAGQLGSYNWADGGSDSPWLSGTPATVGAGEPLTIALDPPVAVASWRARSVPATADGPDGVVVLGEGVGAPAFAAPVAGTWTIEVHVIFADGAGDASYFWMVAVR